MYSDNYCLLFSALERKDYFLLYLAFMVKAWILKVSLIYFISTQFECMDFNFFLEYLNVSLKATSQ